MEHFFHVLKHYAIEIVPSLSFGFFLSGIVHEFLPEDIAQKHLGEKGILPVLYVTILGIILPVCCFGSLPIAISLRKKGVPLGPILAFLVATPATSITAILVTWKLMGALFTIYLSFSVILTGLVIGLIGNMFTFPEAEPETETHHHCCCNDKNCDKPHAKTLGQRIASVFKYGFIDIPRQIGAELIIGILLAAVIGSVSSVGYVVKNYLFGWRGYISALVFGLLMFMCATGSVPMVHAFTNHGLDIGAGLIMILTGPITSYGTILVIRKEFGMKILGVYLGVVSASAVILGVLLSMFFAG
ncbi:permease [Elusimicrobiota bacterium]